MNRFSGENPQSKRWISSLFYKKKVDMQKRTNDTNILLFLVEHSTIKMHIKGMIYN